MKNLLSTGQNQWRTRKESMKEDFERLHSVWQIWFFYPITFLGAPKERNSTGTTEKILRHKKCYTVQHRKVYTTEKFTYNKVHKRVTSAAYKPAKTTSAFASVMKPPLSQKLSIFSCWFEKRWKQQCWLLESLLLQWVNHYSWAYCTVYWLTLEQRRSELPPLRWSPGGSTCLGNRSRRAEWDPGLSSANGSAWTCKGCSQNM